MGWTFKLAWIGGQLQPITMHSKELVIPKQKNPAWLSACLLLSFHNSTALLDMLLYLTVGGRGQQLTQIKQIITH